MSELSAAQALGLTKGLRLLWDETLVAPTSSHQIAAGLGALSALGAYRFRVETKIPFVGAELFELVIGGGAAANINSMWTYDGGAGPVTVPATTTMYMGATGGAGAFYNAWADLDAVVGAPRMHVIRSCISDAGHAVLRKADQVGWYGDTAAAIDELWIRRSLAANSIVAGSNIKLFGLFV